MEVSRQCILQEIFSMHIRTLASLILFVCISCQQRSDQSKLYGRWILDSTSGIGGKIISGGPREHTEFTLKQDKTFIYKWSDVDVFGEFSGTYDYRKQNEDTVPLLIFSFNSRDNKGFSHKDTITVLSLNDTLLKGQEIERYTLLDSTPVVQNRINIYRKH